MKRLKDSEIEEFVNEWAARTGHMFEIWEVGHPVALELGVYELRSMLRGERV